MEYLVNSLLKDRFDNFELEPGDFELVSTTTVQGADAVKANEGEIRSFVVLNLDPNEAAEVEKTVQQLLSDYTPRNKHKEKIIATLQTIIVDVEDFLKKILMDLKALLEVIKNEM